jgi:hypothetical protein
MDPHKRLQVIADLEEKIAEGKQRIAEHQVQRESDPIAYDNFLRAEREDEARRTAKVPVDVPDMIYKEYLPAVPTIEKQDWSGWEKWMRAHLANERAVIYGAVNKLFEAMQLDVIDAFDKLRAETKAQFDAQIEKANALSDVRKQLSTEHGERERLKYETDLAARDARIATLETQVQMLCRFLSVSGLDPPKGII